MNRTDPMGLYAVIDVTYDRGIRGTVPDSMAGTNPWIATNSVGSGIMLGGTWKVAKGQVLDKGTMNKLLNCG